MITHMLGMPTITGDRVIDIVQCSLTVSGSKVEY